MKTKKDVKTNSPFQPSSTLTLSPPEWAASLGWWPNHHHKQDPNPTFTPLFFALVNIKNYHHLDCMYSYIVAFIFVASLVSMILLIDILFSPQVLFLPIYISQHYYIPSWHIIDWYFVSPGLFLSSLCPQSSWEPWFTSSGKEDPLPGHI